MKYQAGIVCASLLACGAAQASGLTATEWRLLQEIAKDEGKRKEANDLLRKTKTNPRVVRVAVAVPTPPPPQTVTHIAHQDIFSEMIRKHETSPSNPEGAQLNRGKPLELSKCAGFSFLLRRDWKDIGPLGCPQKVDKATGAEIAFADDQANHNRIWSINGTAAVTYSSIMDQDEVWWKPSITSFASYVTVNRVANSAVDSASDNVDKLVYGGALSLAFNNETGGNNFTFRGGGVENHIKGTTSANFTAEYSPAYAPLLVHTVVPRVLGLPMNFRYDPELILQYNEATGPKQVLDFNGRSQALRIGPQVSFYLFGLPDGFFAKMNASFTYHWAYETYAQKNLSWLQTALTYNIDDAGHLGVALTYSRGNDEDTGTFTNIYRIGLTGKI